MYCCRMVVLPEGWGTALQTPLPVGLNCRKRGCSLHVVKAAVPVDYATNLAPADVRHMNYAPLDAQSGSQRGRWWGSSVLELRVGSSALGVQLTSACLNLEKFTPGRRVSNRGGWQSADLIGNADPCLAELMDLMHEPLAAFLQGSSTVTSLKNNSDKQGVFIAAVADQLWGNVNRPGHWNARHNHGSPTESLVASCVYYPSMGDSSASQIRLFPPGEEEVIIIPEAGMLLMFPPDLLHEVDAVPPGAIPRVSLAFNLMVRWLPTPLLLAARSGDANSVQVLARDGADVEEAESKQQFRAVHVAAEAGHLEVLQALVELGANPAAISGEGWSPFGLAADRGHTQVARYLYEQSAFGSVSDTDQFDTTMPQTGSYGTDGALAVAAERGHVPIVELLAYAEGHALSRAAAAGHIPVVDLLLQQDADPNARQNSDAPILKATERGHAAVVELLLAAGADANAADKQGKSSAHTAAAFGHFGVMKVLVDAAASSCVDLDATDRDGATPVHWAATQGEGKIVHIMANAGASLEKTATGSMPGRPLHWAVRAGHLELVEQLLHLRADVDSSVDKGMVLQSPTVSHVYTRKGDVWSRINVAEVLERRKISAEAANEDGGSPLHTAASMGQVEIARVLSGAGSSPQSHDRDGASPLHWAAANGHAALVEHLCGTGANLSAPDSAWGRPLHDAAWNGHVAVTKQLIEAGARVDDQDSKGRTALHAAAVLGLDRIAEVLLDNGAVADVPSHDGQTPKDLVAQAVRVLEVLRSRSRSYGEAMFAQTKRLEALLDQGSRTSS